MYLSGVGPSVVPEGPIVKPGTVPEGCGGLVSAWGWLVKAWSVCRQAPAVPIAPGMGLRRSARLGDRLPVTDVEAAEALLALGAVVATPDRPGLGCSGSAEAMSGRPGSHVGPTRPRGPLPMSDAEAGEEAGPSGLQDAEEAGAEPLQLPADDDIDRTSDVDQGDGDQAHSIAERPWWRPGEGSLIMMAHALVN